MRLPRGITKTPTGWRISLGAAGALRKRFPKTYTLEQVEGELAKLRKSRTAGTLTEAPGSFAADVVRYLRDFYQGRPGYEERERHLTLWTDALGPDIDRATIVRDDIARILNGWRAAGLAADTCNKRRTALLALFHALDGKGASNPVREIPKFRAPDPLARGLAYELIEKALKTMPRHKTRARLAVMAYTGMRPKQLAAFTPDLWHRKQGMLTVPGTAKGRGTKPYTIPISPPCLEALQEFERLDAWGRFTMSPVDRMWKAAATAAKLPPGTVPYDLRHSFGTAIYRQTGDLKVTKELMGHSAIRMTERYTLAAVPERQQRAIAAAFPKKGKIKKRKGRKS